MGGPQLEILKKRMEFLENFSKILKFMEKITPNVPDKVVTDISERFHYLEDQPFTVQNVKFSDNKYLLTKTHVGDI